MHQKKFLLAVVLVTSAIVILITTIIRGHGEAVSRAAYSAAEPLDEKSAQVAVALPLFHRLSEHYIRGGVPAHDGIDVLRRLGVKTLVDLRSVYDYTDDIKAAAEAVGLRYRWLPMSVWNPPTHAQSREFVRTVTDASAGPFYVFCADGLNRTGEMSAIYRIASDHWTIEQALKEMDDLGFNPYYYTLRSYVWTYARKFNPEAVPRSARRLSSFEQ